MTYGKKWYQKWPIWLISVILSAVISHYAVQQLPTSEPSNSDLMKEIVSIKEEIIHKNAFGQDIESERNELLELGKGVDHAFKKWEKDQKDIGAGELVDLLFAEASALKEAGEYYKAYDSIKKAYRINPVDFDVVNLYGRVLQDIAKYDEAERKFKDAIELADSDKNLATAKGNLAGVLQDQGKYEESENLYRETLDIDRNAYEAGHPSIAIDLGNLAGVLRNQGKYEESEKLYRESLEVKRNSYEASHPYIAIDLGNLAQLYYAKEEYKKAKEHIDEAVEIFEKTFDDDHPQMQIIYDNRDAIYKKLAEK